MSLPLIAAPMAGDPGTPDLVRAASRAGGLGFLAGGYKTAAQLAIQITAVRADVSTFGVNLFAPNPVPVDREAFRRFTAIVRTESDRYGLTVPDTEPVQDDDHWEEKVSLLLADPVAVVSFTFAIPAFTLVKALQRQGSVIVQTVTSVPEARRAAAAGVDVLAVQSAAAGGHLGTLTPAVAPSAAPLRALLEEIRQVTNLPLIAAGGLGTPVEVRRVLQAHAEAAMVGTVLLRSPESGAAPPYKAALSDPRHRDTIVTRAFTGRPARALRNEFTDTYGPREIAGYPAVHHLTSPMRRAAAAAGDPERMNLWAGTGFREATDEPAEVILRRLATAL